jgi:hypothetical protein
MPDDQQHPDPSYCIYHYDGTVYISGNSDGLRRAHKMHHRHPGKEDGESFGFLYIHRRYRDKIKRERLMHKKNDAGKHTHAIL